MKVPPRPTNLVSSTASHEAWKTPGLGISYLSEPDSLLASDYLETTRRKSHQEPEKELMLAVLEEAIDCFQMNVFKKTRKQEILFREAEDWILDDNSHWLFSFDIICETLDIDPNYLRSKLLAWKYTKLAQLQSLRN